ncbi:hypothetical protein [Pollutibacter soli]|uniref:DNA polymerase III subunit n=1 Tax=Pollutibacter soli TaxID=3034157 RepID=UPI0030132DA8
MQFSDIPGHHLVKEQLVSLVANNRLSHALLFSGRDGSGALAMAIAFAQYLVCEKVNSIQSENSAGTSLFGEEDASENKDTILTDSCGVCPACVKSTNIAHPDIHYSFPVIPLKSGTPPISADYFSEWRSFIREHPFSNTYDWLTSISAENKQGNITARECEDILQQLNLKSFESGYKILIMWAPEYLGKEGNKLLKMIEEPPADTLFILVAEDESQILPTILSRTQIVKIPLFENEDIVSILKNKYKISGEKATAIAAFADGNLREAISSIQEAEEDWLKYAREWMNGVVKNGPVTQVRLADELNKLGREKQKQFFSYMIHLVEQSMRFAALKKHQDHLQEKEQEFTDRFSVMTSFFQQEAIISELEKGIYYIERNANFKLLFVAMSIKFSHIIKYNSLILIN